MQNFDKTYPPLFVAEVNRPVSLKQAKTFFWQALPVIFNVVSVGFVLLILQAFLIGVADRFGVSPKVGFLSSSVFFAGVFLVLAAGGSLKRHEAFENTEFVSTKEPVCKILIIKSEKR